jgi:S1-C subfamily serine protease
MARSILFSPVLLAIIASTQFGLSQAESPRQTAPSPLTGLTSISESKSARQIAQEAFPSVVLLVMQDSNGQPTSLGSGFVLRDGIVATNHHVITGAASGYCRVVGKNMKYEVAGTVGIDETHDLAIVAVNGLKAPAMPVGDSSQVAVGDEVFAVGNPQGLEGTFSQGIISAVRRVDNETFFQLTAPISPGSSGGPILDSSGKTIGIAVATFTGGQNLNLAIPSSYLNALAERITPDVLPLSRQRVGTKERSIIDALGEPSSKGVVGEKFFWDGEFGYYSFSLRNQLREDVRNVEYLVVFLARDGKPVDLARHTLHEVIPGGLAKRVTGLVTGSVYRLSKRVEVRILDFRLAE